MIITNPNPKTPTLGLFQFALNKITRYIATLKASDGGYINLPQPIEIAADDDFELEMVVQVERDDANYDVLLRSLEEPNSLMVQKQRYVEGGQPWENGSYQIQMTSDVGIKYFDLIPENRNPDYVTKFNKLRIVRQGKVATFYAGDAVQSSLDIGAESWLPFTIGRINGQATCRFLKFKFTKNGQVIFETDLNAKHGTTVIPNLSQPLGTELYADNPFVVANEGTVTKLASDSWSVQTPYGGPNNLAYGARILNFPVTPNESYLFKVEANEDVNLLAYNSAYQLISRGVNEVLFTTTENVVLLYVTPRTLNEIIFKNPTIKKAPHWAEYINVTDDSKALYTFDSERNAWLGEELWNTSTGYAVNTGASTSTYDGQVGHLQTTGDYTGFRQVDVQTVGSTYLFSCEVFDVIDSGSGYLTLGENYGDGRNIQITPKLDAIFKADSTYAQVKRAHGSYDLKLRNISFKHILEVAQ